MSIQRWRIDTSGSEYVTYADYVAALADAEQRMERITREDDNRALWDNRQWNAALDAVRKAVVATDAPCSGLCECIPHALAAIDELAREGE
jgi:hypothetical protein